jgi:hypothetical protein
LRLQQANKFCSRWRVQNLNGVVLLLKNQPIRLRSLAPRSLTESHQAHQHPPLCMRCSKCDSQRSSPQENLMRPSRNCPYPENTPTLVRRTKRNRVSPSNPRLKRGDGTRQAVQWLAIKALEHGKSQR